MLIAGWDRGKPAAFDVTVASPLCPAILTDSSRMSGAESATAETRKILTNGPKCQELGWTCIPLAVETFCNWGKEAHLTFSRLASHLSISLSSPKPCVLADIYSRLNTTLVKSIHCQSHLGKGAPALMTVVELLYIGVVCNNNNNNITVGGSILIMFSIRVFSCIL